MCPEGIIEQKNYYPAAIESAATSRIDGQKPRLFFEKESIAAIFHYSPAI